MINAIEVKKMMPNKTPIEVILPDALADAMPMIEEKITSLAKNGLTSCSVLKREIMLSLKEFYFLSSKDIMNAIAKEAVKAGFVVYIPPSYSSIEFSWRK